METREAQLWSNDNKEDNKDSNEKDDNNNKQNDVPEIPLETLLCYSTARCLAGSHQTPSRACLCELETNIGKGSLRQRAKRTGLQEAVGHAS